MRKGPLSSPLIDFIPTPAADQHSFHVMDGLYAGGYVVVDVYIYTSPDDHGYHYGTK